MHRASIPSILTPPNQPRRFAKLSKRCVVAALTDAMHLTRRNPHPAQHLAAIAQPRARWLALRKTFKNLDTDFLRDRTSDLAHAIPEPDYFPLLLDIH